MYRFEKLAFSIQPTAPAAGTGVIVFGYSNETDDNLPTNVSQVASLPVSLCTNAFVTVPLLLKIPRSVLIGQNAQKFWRSQISTAGTPSSNLWDDIQGTLHIRHALAASATFNIMTMFTVTLCDAQSPAMNPKPHFTCVGPTGKCVLVANGCYCPSHSQRAQKLMPLSDAGTL